VTSFPTLAGPDGVSAPPSYVAGNRDVTARTYVSVLTKVLSKRTAVGNLYKIDI